MKEKPQSQPEPEPEPKPQPPKTLDLHDGKPLTGTEFSCWMTGTAGKKMPK